MEDARLTLAHRVLATLVREPVVRAAALRGSLVTGGADEFSDIDLVVDVSGTDNGRFAAQVPALLGRQFPLLFADWAPSLLPDTYVRTCFLDGVPVFWNVDIECSATPHVPSVTSVAVDRYDHLLKLWVLDAKYLLRGAASAEPNIRRLAARALSVEEQATDDPRRLRGCVFDELAG